MEALSNAVTRSFLVYSGESFTFSDDTYAISYNQVASLFDLQVFRDVVKVFEALKGIVTLPLIQKISSTLSYLKWRINIYRSW